MLFSRKLWFWSVLHFFMEIKATVAFCNHGKQNDLKFRQMRFFYWCFSPQSTLKFLFVAQSKPVFKSVKLEVNGDSRWERGRERWKLAEENIDANTSSAHLSLFFLLPFPLICSPSSCPKVRSVPLLWQVEERASLEVSSAPWCQFAAVVSWGAGKCLFLCSAVPHLWDLLKNSFWICFYFLYIEAKLRL